MSKEGLSDLSRGFLEGHAVNENLCLHGPDLELHSVVVDTDVGVEMEL